MRWRSLMWILWPSFLVGAATSATVFAFIDPLDITFLGYLRASRELVYALGFFLFWSMAAVSSALTLHLAPRGRETDEFDDPVDR
ncbi:MAG: hypothetical protein AB7E12_02920 [Burkholderiaceae bacterium]